MPTFARPSFHQAEHVDEEDIFSFDNAQPHTGFAEFLRENALLVSGVGLVLIAVCMAISAVPGI
ncbi:hypothetical protein [Roseibium sp. SCP14]|uniref:hypothetical protein n=1 Tax=Roseibium sp. SCP14 TaxID=3141375 RepID=UPI00333B8CC0